MTHRSPTSRRRCAVGLTAMAVLSFLPALLTAPGVMPADTKLYLSVDPARLLRAAPYLWDNSQFGGWVTHQTIGYLWPTGPWYWGLEHIGVPAWVAQRLWVGLLFLAAGTGVWWCARRLGLAHRGAFAAGLLYQLSPYVLPYASRTSVLLSPWAGLGWLVGLTVLAERRGGWRFPAAFALVVATVGGINATAIALVALAPVIWLVHAAAVAKEVSLRRALATGARIATLSILVSLWWLVALIVQARYGANVLAYSETVKAVSSTSLGSEVLRGLGYWLFYGGDVTGRWTGASTPYLQNPGLIGLGFVLAGLGLLGILLVRWRDRAFLAALVVAGTVVAVGAHGDSPLANGLRGSARTTLVLGLRSSTRAVPLILLGFGLGVGALLTAWSPRLPRATLAVTGAVGLLAVLGLPALWTGRLVDPLLRHPQELPAWWHEAARRLDAGVPAYRVLELPGAEFAAQRWGTTTDPILPGLTSRQTIARDLLPLGSPATMDLLYALDDRFQDGVAERATVAPVARLLGADQVLFRGDVAFERYQGPRPDETWAFYADSSAGDGLGAPVAIGPQRANIPAIAVDDEAGLSSRTSGSPVPQLALVPVEDAKPIVRVADGRRVVVLAGSGAGVVDAAAAGLVDGNELLRYSADRTTSADVPEGALLIVTDSNRKQARQWRGSQETTGFTEDERTGTLVRDEADHRLPVFGASSGATDEQTLGLQRGAIRATASAYGTPNAYWPEDRAAFAVDGDPATAWRVDAGAPAFGQVLRLDLPAARELTTIRLLQPPSPANRRITDVRLRTAGGQRSALLDATSWTGGGQELALPVGRSSWIEIEITGTTVGHLVNYAGQDPVGFAEASVAGLTAEEVVRTPTALLADLGPASSSHPLAFVLTRQRVDARKRWRDDPEPALVRDITLPAERSFELGGLARLSPRASDAVLSALRPHAATTAVVNSRLAGVPSAGGHAAVDGDPATAWQTSFGPATGAAITVTADVGTTVDHLDLELLVDGRHSVPTALTLSNGSEQRVLAVPRIADQPARTSPTAVHLPFPALSGRQFTLAIAGTRDVTTLDRHDQLPVVLPVAVAEVGLSGVPPAAPEPETFDTGCRNDLLSVDGQAVSVRIAGAVADLQTASLPVVTCGPSRTLTLGPGEHVLRAAPGRRTGIDLDRVVLTSAPGGKAAPASALRAPSETSAVHVSAASAGRVNHSVRVVGATAPFWLVFGEGFNRGWHATVGGRDLGPPRPVDGGMNGWYVTPNGTDPVTIHLSWRPQRLVWLGLAASLVGVVLCGALLFSRASDGRTDILPAGLPTPRHVFGRSSIARPIAWRPLLTATLITAVVTAVAAQALLGVAVAAAMLIAGRFSRAHRLCAVCSVAALGATAAFYVARQVRSHPIEGFGWTSLFEPAHRLALAAVALLAADVILDQLAHRRTD